MKAIERLRAAGATVVFDDSILPDSYAKMVNQVRTLPYIREGTENFLKQYGPAEYRSTAEYQKAVGSPLPTIIIGGPAAAGDAATPAAALVQSAIETIRRRKLMSLFHDARPWTRISKRSTECISAALCTPPRRCPLLTKPCRRMEPLVVDHIATQVGSTTSAYPQS